MSKVIVGEFAKLPLLVMGNKDKDNKDNNIYKSLLLENSKPNINN